MQGAAVPESGFWPPVRPSWGPLPGAVLIGLLSPGDLATAVCRLLHSSGSAYPQVELGSFSLLWPFLVPLS